MLLASANDPHSDNVLTILNDTAKGMLTARYLIHKDNSSDSSLGERIKQYQQVASEQDRILWMVRAALVAGYWRGNGCNYIHKSKKAKNKSVYFIRNKLVFLYAATQL